MKKVQLQSYLSERISIELQRNVNRSLKLKGLQHYALMADAHLADQAAVGSVIATKDYLYPRAIGKDIGCGMLTVPFDLDANQFLFRMPELLVELQKSQPLIKQSSLETAPKLPNSLRVEELHCYGGESWSRLARIEAGTVGRGNHFIEFQIDEQEQVWLIVHTGSRGIGQKISLSYEDCLAADSVEGEAFLADMHWAISYAEWNRQLILEKISELMKRLFLSRLLLEEMIHCQHDHIRQENHFGEDLWVHRKGANSADKGEAVIIAGSMATPTHHVEGKGEALSLKSCSHGAGRCMSRSEARSRISTHKLQQETQMVYYDQRRLKARCEEAPSAYKDIDELMKQQRKLVKIKRRLRPVLNYRF